MEPCTEPLKVEAVNGVLLIDGACGVAVTLTPEAGVATADHLLDEAAMAIGQTKMPGYRPKV